MVDQPATALERLRQFWNEAAGGVLRITMLDGLLADQNAVPLLHGLRNLMLEDPSVTVIVDGDRESASQLHALSPELFLMFRHAHVAAFTPKQMAELFMTSVARQRFGMEPGIRVQLEGMFTGVRGVGDLTNGRITRVLSSRALGNALKEGRKQVRLSDVDVRLLRTVDFTSRSGFDDLDLLIGLDDVKTTVRQWVANSGLLLRREQLGLAGGGAGQHMVFKGPAGTAKTTVARIVGHVLAETGVLTSGHLVETQRADLVGEHSEQTTRRVVEAVKRALGGVLFIDEAYTLTQSVGERDPGREAVDTLLKLMEDYRDEFIVVAAGYPVHMEQFLNANPGLRSRFVRVLDFPSYDVPELLAILDVLAKQAGFTLAPDVHEALIPEISLAMHYPGFGNGRHMRNLLDMAIVRQATRLDATSSDDDLRTLRSIDFVEERPEVSTVAFG